jgi:hypothetical protein
MSDRAIKLVKAKRFSRLLAVEQDPQLGHVAFL